MRHCVYMLRCSDGSIYVGMTSNLPLRVVMHNAGVAARYTARRRPVKLVFKEAHPTRSSAMTRERQLKGWTRTKKEWLIGLTRDRGPE